MRVYVLIASAAALAAATAGTAFCYDASGHRLLTSASVALVSGPDGSLPAGLLAGQGVCPEIQSARRREASFKQLSPAQMLISETPAVDDYRDLEFVDVEGGLGDGGRDNPHKFELNAINDKASCSQGPMSYTAFNHFIDIRKGPGKFDDFDGYSYHNGSGSKDERQRADSVEGSWGQELAAKITRFKVDEGVMWWLNDEYVHAPGSQWYKNCSPSLERYSFFQDTRRFPDAKAELAARFPLAKSVGAKNSGVPYSVFMPLDNLARYWFKRFDETRDVLALAPVLHAIQDATIPHHAAGCLGNWHSQYETSATERAAAWLADPAFQSEVRSLLDSWRIPDSSPPASLGVSDWGLRPSISWKIEQLVTWLALNSFQEYSTTYSEFKDGFNLNEPSARKLAGMAEAMTALVLAKAAGEGPRGPAGVLITVAEMPVGSSEMPVGVAAGGTFSVRIPANHTTGFQWKLVEPLDTSVVRCTGSTYEAPANGLPGQGGSEVWTFSAVKPGTADVVLEYKRPWEPGSKPVASQTFKVTVGASL